MFYRCGIENEETGLFIGATKYPDRKKPSLVVQRGNEAAVVGSFTDQLCVDYFIDALMEVLGETPKKCNRKAEDCRFYTVKGILGAGCLATKEIDPCKGDNCENWKPKEE